ncbi:MAG: GDSL family lipase [Clostridia bacterium]|nr:GDSL family lipase [Clostridia bacterium]
MNVFDLCKQKQENLVSNKPVTIAFLGDSVTQGCFECYLTGPNSLQTVFDYKSAFSTRMKEILNLLYPSVQINIVNSGISGDSAPVGAKRLERDILAQNPDLVVVSYGLNDSTGGMSKIVNYCEALEEIFSRLKERGIQTVFLTQNYMNTKTSPHLKDELFIGLSKEFSKNVQNSGVLKAYFEAAKESCQKYGVKVCDLYPVWERLEQAGVEVTELLANKLNHPIREFHYYMAIKLIETILFE